MPHSGAAKELLLSPEVDSTSPRGLLGGKEDCDMALASRLSAAPQWGTAWHAVGGAETAAVGLVGTITIPPSALSSCCASFVALM